MATDVESEVISKGPCSACGSSDGNASYDDGHTYCFVCKEYVHGEAPAAPSTPSKAPKRGDKMIPQGEAQALKARGLTKKTCERWGYTVGKLGGEPVQIANYRDDDRTVTAQKVKTASKEFVFLGDKKKAGLYGRHLWKGGGRRVIITEGEPDALAVDQVLGAKWQVVSLQNGSSAARKSLAADLEWLNSFEQVVLCFDMDEPGRAAVQDCATLFKPGKLHIVSLPLKDANEMVMAGRVEELVTALWGAKAYRPDGLITVSDIMDKVLKEPEVGLPWCFPSLTKQTFGRRYGEAVALGAGTGVGKTTFLTQQIAFDLSLGLPVGVFAFEQAPEETVKRVAGQTAGRQFHVPDDGWTQSELVAAVEDLRDGPGLHLYDHWGGCEWDIVKERIRFLVHNHGVRLIYLDHLTALAAAEADEKTGLERIMSEMGSLVKELNIWLLFVSHLATPDGTPHEEGGRVKIRHFKGSRSIGFWSHFMFGMERDQQPDEDDDDADSDTTFRVLKDRFTGRSTGLTFPIRYNPRNGLLEEAEAAPRKPMFAAATTTADDPF